MSDDKKQYATAIGIVQSFVKNGVREPAVKAGQTQNGQVVHNLTIQTASQVYVDLALWQEYAHMAMNIQAGYGIMARGPLTQTQGNNGRVFNKINVAELIVIPCVARQEREVVNQVAPVAVAQTQAASPAADSNPFSGVSL